MVSLASATYPLGFLADWSAWQQKTRQWVEQACHRKAELLVFPEYGAMELASLAGLEAAQSLPNSILAVSERMDEANAHWEALAREFGVCLLAPSGPVSVNGISPVNRATLFGPEGLIGYQDKQIMTRFENEEWYISPGELAPRVFDTPFGRIGVLICYDVEFPLLARRLVEAGADILLVPSCTDSLAGYHRVRIGAMARALEGQCVCAMASITGTNDWCPAVDVNHGAGAIFTPPDRGFAADGIAAMGQMDQAGWAVAEIDLAALRELRHSGTVLNYQDWERQG